jgi:hypothetical protein
MTCTHDPLTLYATVALLAFAAFTITFGCWLGTRLADAVWRWIGRAKKG